VTRNKSALVTVIHGTMTAMSRLGDLERVALGEKLGTTQRDPVGETVERMTPHEIIGMAHRDLRRGLGATLRVKRVHRKKNWTFQMMNQR
jgi:hypothetical protein